MPGRVACTVDDKTAYEVSMGIIEDEAATWKT
jgi:hypothetical protein